MTAQKLWHNLALKFRAISDPDNNIHAKWKHLAGSPHDTQWEIGGAASAEERTQLLNLAKFAGSRIAPDAKDPLRVWLNKLKDTRPAHEIDIRQYTQPERTGLSYELGTLKELRNASANLCDELELVSMVNAVHPEIGGAPSANLVRRIARQVEKSHGPKSDDPTHSNISEAQAGQHSKETIGQQIKRLRDECRWTLEELAEVTKSNERNIQRHEADKVVPYARTIRTYERVFSKELERKVVINRMS